MAVLARPHPAIRVAQRCALHDSQRDGHAPKALDPRRCRLVSGMQAAVSQISIDESRVEHISCRTVLDLTPFYALRAEHVSG